MSLVPSDSLRAYLERTSKEYHEQLSPDAKEYLAGRGFDQETAARFRFGLVADPAPGHEKYRGCLAIPYLTPSGSVTSIRFRPLNETKSKYLTVEGDQPRIYNTAALDKGTRSICVAEGEFDCAIADMCGLPAIGLPGVNSWIKVFSRLLRQYDAVYTLSDDDEAGHGLVATMAKDLDNIRDVPMQVGDPLSGGDVNKFFLEYGADELKKKVGAR